MQHVNYLDFHASYNRPHWLLKTTIFNAAHFYIQYWTLSHHYCTMCAIMHAKIGPVPGGLTNTGTGTRDKGTKPKYYRGQGNVVKALWKAKEQWENFQRNIETQIPLGEPLF